MSKVDITISIVTYNSRNVLKGCIDSIINTIEGISYEIIVVDNSSVDGTAGFIKEHSLSVTLIENKENVGFGRAHNQAFKLAKGKFFLILNPDTIIFPGAIDRIFRFMEANEKAGAVGCKIWWDDERNFMFPDLKIHTLKTAFINFTPFCRYFPNSSISRNYWRSAHRLWTSGMPIEAEGVTGGFMMLRREAFESAGLFDENFFLFFEEHDLLRRIKNADWDIYYLPDAEIQHYFEESFRNSDIDIRRVYIESALYYYRKYYKTPGHLLIKSLLILNKFILFIEIKILNIKQNYAEICPTAGKIIIDWPRYKKATRYLVEISYSPDFRDRGGMYTKGESLSLASDILKRLPNQTGFLRVLPVYAGTTIGRIIKTVKISNHPERTD